MPPLPRSPRPAAANSQGRAGSSFIPDPEGRRNGGSGGMMEGSVSPRIIDGAGRLHLRPLEGGRKAEKKERVKLRGHKGSVK